MLETQSTTGNKIAPAFSHVETVQTLVRLLPSLVVILVIVSLLKLHLYYKLFGVSILEHVSLGETVLMFFDNIETYVLISIYTLALITRSLQVKLTSSLKKTRMDYREYFEDRRLISLWFILTLAALVYHYLIASVSWREYLLMPAILFFIYIIIPILIDKFGPNKFTVKSLEAFGLISFFLFMLGMSVTSSVNDFYKVRHGRYYKDVVVTLIDGTTLKSSGTSTYIGQTKSAILWHHAEKGTVTATPLHQIKAVSF